MPPERSSAKRADGPSTEGRSAERPPGRPDGTSGRPPVEPEEVQPARAPDGASRSGAAAAADTRRARLWEAAAERGIPLQAILAVAGVVVAVYLAGLLIYKIRAILMWLVLAGFLALLLNPSVVFFQRHVVRRRGGAVALVIFLAVLVFAGLAFAFGYPLVNGLTHLAQNLPKYVRQAEHGKGWIGHLVAKYHVQRWVQHSLAPKLTSYAQSLSKPALSLGKGAVSLIVALLTVFIMTVLLLVEGPLLRRGLLRMIRPERRGRVIRVSGEVSHSVTGFMAGNLLTSVIAGILVGVTLSILGVPFALLLALWVALVDFLPEIGGALAGIPTIAFAFIHSVSAGIVMLVVFVVYWQLENRILNPVVMSKTVKINPLLILVAMLVGANIGDLVGGLFGGFVAALLAIPAAASIQVIVREVWQSTAPEEEVDREGPPGAMAVVKAEGQAGSGAS